MRTTIDIPDELFRRAKATAALEGGTLKDLVTEALRDYLDRRGEPATELRGWRRVFGMASSEEDRAELARIDAIIEEECERIFPEEWE
jgi:hypothetical protein